MANRWRVIAGMNGERLQGLDMAQIEPVLRLSGVKRKERERIFAGLRVMEAAALARIYG
jgi:hypothetical protein